MGHNANQNRATIISLFIAFTLIIGGAGGVIGYYINLNTPVAEPSPPPLTAGPATAPSSESGPVPFQPPSPNPDIVSGDTPAVPAFSSNGIMSIQEVFKRGDLSTVAITVTGEGSPGAFGRSGQEASGSGFILTADGYILTNHHVVEGAAEVAVMLYDGSEYPAEVVGSDAFTDIAVIRINASGLSPVRIGNSDDVLVGDQVVAIGNPLGDLANSLTVGYISGKKRIVFIESNPHIMLQTDAAVSPGNSGGPLFNLFGEVIGVVTAKAVGADVEGIGFAIPVNDAAKIAEELIKYGSIPGRPLLGITYREISASDGEGLPGGVYITEVTEDSPAGRGGLKRDDIITVFNGERVTGGAQLLIALNGRRVGDTVTITVLRGGTELTLTVRLDAERPGGARPQPPQRPAFPWGR